jgi:hypothetical protein
LLVIIVIIVVVIIIIIIIVVVVVAIAAVTGRARTWGTRLERSGTGGFFRRGRC